MSDTKQYVDYSRISAQVYHIQPEKGIYYVKVSIPSLNVYINSFQVKPSIKFPEHGLWIQWPSFKVGARWIKPIEFSGESQFKSYIEDEINRAVATYDHKDVVVEVDDKKPINLDDIPF